MRQASPTFPKYHASKRSLNLDSKMLTDVLPKGLPQHAGRILILCPICFHCLGDARCRDQSVFYLLWVSCLGGGQADSPSIDFSDSTLSIHVKLLWARRKHTGIWWGNLLLLLLFSKRRSTGKCSINTTKPQNSFEMTCFYISSNTGCFFFIQWSILMTTRMFCLFVKFCSSDKVYPLPKFHTIIELENCKNPLKPSR